MIKQLFSPAIDKLTSEFENEGVFSAQELQSLACEMYQTLKELGFSEVDDFSRKRQLSDKYHEISNSIDRGQLIIQNHLKIQLGLNLIEDDDMPTDTKRKYLENYALFNVHAFSNPWNCIPQHDHAFCIEITDQLLKRVLHYAKDRRVYVREWANEIMDGYKDSITVILTKLQQQGYPIDNSTLIDFDSIDLAYHSLDGDEKEALKFQLNLEQQYNRYTFNDLTLDYVVRLFAEAIYGYVGSTNNESILKVNVLLELIQEIQMRNDSKSSEFLNAVGIKTMMLALKPTNRR